ncbi:MULTISPECIES: hypothetical protein [Prevotella]|nr:MULTISPECIES: hypothetical protein [Prevotella]MEE0620848.1 hypothetical protein [Prevotella sp.]
MDTAAGNTPTATPHTTRVADFEDSVSRSADCCHQHRRHGDYARR